MDEQRALASLLDEGRAAFKAEDYVRSEEVFLRALAGSADEPDSRLHLARIYNQWKDWPKALEQWKWLRDREPGKLEPELQVARALFRLKRHAEARDAFKAVLAVASDHAEAHQRLLEIEALQQGDHHLKTPDEEIAPGAAILNEARAAFKEEDYARSEALFLRALEMGADEATGRLHLARIYNLEQNWPKAQTQWKWLRNHLPASVEPHLQVARGHFRLGEYGEAIVAFKSVLGLQPDHAEAQQSLQKIAAIQEQDAFPRDSTDDVSWLSLVPAEIRWKLSTGLLGAGVDAIGTLIDLANRQTEALSELVNAYGDSEGALGGHRHRYALQAVAKIDELVEQLKDAKRSARALAKRTSAMFETFDKFTGQAAPSLPPVKQPLSRNVWRETLVNLACDIHRAHGLEPALSWLLREALVEDRPAIFADLATALRETDRDASIRLLWLSYGAKPSPAIAERTASKMFQNGNLSSASALVKAAPSGTSSPFAVEMRSSASMFREGVRIPPMSQVSFASERVAYVASGSLPFQVAGYTIRTHQLMTGLARAGVDCVCFTRPGFPWDRPRAMSSGQATPEKHTVGEVTYVHTPLPDASRHPERLVEMASAALEQHFRAYRIGVVQAASNSRNALPALMAARRVGAKFIYEVRGLWELTAASRFAGWEETDRYRLDRDLEVMVAAQADHVLTITRGVAAELINGGVSPERLSLLPNAVDPDAFRPLPKDRALMARFGLQDEDFVAVYAGSLTNYEGLDDVIVALSLLKRDGMRPRMVIAGDGAARAELEALTVDRGMAAEVTFAGRVKPEEIEAYLSLADVVPIPRKPFKVCMVVSPLKPFEAMSMAKAVVLSDLPALREIVSDGETGLICRPADPTDLAAVFSRLAKDPALRERLGRTARQWVKDHRSWAENAARLKRLYQTLNGTLDGAPGVDLDSALDSSDLIAPGGEALLG